MALPPGTRLGVYEIVGAIGAGGMGEVYRARDPRLGRDVALKTLPPEFSTDADRLRRFEQEARAAATLNHPNILAVYDVGTHDDVSYVVSELLEGGTLRERLRTTSAPGTQAALPVRKAIDYAVQVARGLAAAHEKGIIHRDLKPENLFVTSDGHVKILDFGLAKLVQPAGPTDATVAANTDPGLVLGTVGYMAPEQVRGLPVDHRTDIFAFGAVLYEMLAGHKAFQGATSADTIAAIVKDDPPDLPAAEPHIPPALARIVDRCLEKSPTARFQSASDLGFALEALSAASGSTEAAQVASPVARRWHDRAAWIVAAVLGIGLIGTGAIAVRHVREAPPEAPLVRFPIAAPDGGVLADTAPAVISPDGRSVVFGADVAGARSLWIRRLSELNATVLPGTAGATYPFWSPDSASIGFFADGKLKRMPVEGGSPVVVCGECNSNGLGGGAWAPDDTIVFAASGVAPLQKVPAAGGTPAPVSALAEAETGHRWPSFLPDGRRFLFVSTPRGLVAGQPVDAWVGSLDSDQRTSLGVVADSHVQYAAGHLLFVRGGNLMARPFDREPKGDAVSIAQPVGFGAASRLARFSASNAGVLAYQPAPGLSSLTWFDRSGRRLGTVGDSGIYFNLALSRDERHLAVSRLFPPQQLAGNINIWRVDLGSGAASKVTSYPAVEHDPAWSPDDADVVFQRISRSTGTFDLYRAAADGSSESLLLGVELATTTPDWSRDGRFVLYGYGGDIWVLPLSGSPAPHPFMETPFTEIGPALSPDGRWLAYTTDETGRQEIHVRPFPGGEGKYVVSRGGGRSSSWRGDSKELFYLAPDGTLMAASIDTTNGFHVTSRQSLFNTGIVVLLHRRPYAVNQQGDRFLIPVPDDPTIAQQIRVVLNWTAELAK